MKYEDAAEKVTITKPDGSAIDGWISKTNTNVVWLEEHMARYNGCTDMPCSECDGRMEKGWTLCEKCRAKHDQKRWDEAYKNAVAWDGKEYLNAYDTDKFFFDADELGEYLYEFMEAGGVLEDVQLVHTKPDNGRHFEMSEYLCDCIPEDGEIDDLEINKTVNDWIAANSPFCWWPDDKRPIDIESIRQLWNEVKADFDRGKGKAGGVT